MQQTPEDFVVVGDQGRDITPKSVVSSTKEWKDRNPIKVVSYVNTC